MKSNVRIHSQVECCYAGVNDDGLVAFHYSNDQFEERGPGVRRSDFQYRDQSWESYKTPSSWHLPHHCTGANHRRLGACRRREPVVRSGRRTIGRCSRFGRRRSGDADLFARFQSGWLGWHGNFWFIHPYGYTFQTVTNSISPITPCTSVRELRSSHSRSSYFGLAPDKYWISAHISHLFPAPSRP